MEFKSQFGPWALITGASEAVGRAFAFELAARGLNIILSSRNRENLNTIAAEIERRFGVSTRVLVTDLSEPGAVDVLYVRCADLDIGLVISNAGAANFHNYLDCGLSEVRDGIQLNVGAHADLARFFGDAMLRRRQGRGGLLFMSSIVGLQGAPFMSLFSASKAFVLNFAEALHYENKDLGIHVTAVAPGPIHSSMLQIQPESEKVFRQYQLSVLNPEKVAKGALSALAKNKAIYIPGRSMRIRYGLWRQYFHSRSANVSRWGKLIERYMKTTLPVAFLKTK